MKLESQFSNMEGNFSEEIEIMEKTSRNVKNENLNKSNKKHSG
jgi:hypothetical protein